jgi:N-acyl-L-homoserine lactone synthetase
VEVFEQLADEFNRIREELFKEENGWNDLPAHAMGT